jgi:N-methylhydantoinase A/oxoprolinase/acetone carboxylase beta subunit
MTDPGWQYWIDRGGAFTDVVARDAEKSRPRPPRLFSPPRPRVISVRTSEAVEAAAKVAARADHRTLSPWVELAMIAALERRKAKKA